MKERWQLPLFAYGTLMFPEVIRSVVGRIPDSETGILKGFCRRALRGKSFPGIFRSPGDQVEGLLYSMLSKEEWMLLNEFEDDFYELVEVDISSPSGQTTALAYIIPGTHGNLLEERGWEPDKFRANSLTRFLTDHN